MTIELRPALVRDEAPIVLGARPCLRRDATLRPLMRGALLAAVLSAALALPVIRPLAVGRMPRLDRTEASNAGVVALRKDDARVVPVRAASR